MADPQLVTLAKHCRREAAADQARLANAHVTDKAYADRIRHRIQLWKQIADEIDAYLAGDLQQPDQDQPTLLRGGT